MNLGRCMLRECKTCKFETRCFKEYQNEYTKNKNNRTKTSRIQSKYCDVIIRRWEKLTGQKAELEKK